MFLAKIVRLFKTGFVVVKEDTWQSVSFPGTPCVYKRHSSWVQSTFWPYTFQSKLIVWWGPKNGIIRFYAWLCAKLQNLPFPVSGWPAFCALISVPFATIDIFISNNFQNLSSKELCRRVRQDHYAAIFETCLSGNLINFWDCAWFCQEPTAQELFVSIRKSNIEWAN